jgi:GNAT superfamily N-acetyltransferase
VVLIVEINEYKMNPCRLSSIPYWKIRTIKIPDNISVVHDEDYNINPSSLKKDTIYFRLKHNLKLVELFTLDKLFEYRSIDFTCISDLEAIVDIINKSYTDIQVDLNQVVSWTKLEVFDEHLWIFIIDTNTQKPVALGIAEWDKEVREGMLEWIQVLPEYRGRKLGQAIVNKLLVILSNHVDFVTVSGQMDNKTNPEKLYRKCGFEGKDIWHVIIRR